MYPQYSVEILKFHVMKLLEEGFTRNQLSAKLDINLSRLFSDDAYRKSKQASTYKIVKKLHQSGYHRERELPEMLALVEKPASFNAYLLNSKNALELFDKLANFNRACYSGNRYGWSEQGDTIEFYIRQCEFEKAYSTSQGMIFYVILMLKQLLGEHVHLAAGASSADYPDRVTFEKHATKDLKFDQPYSYVRLDKAAATSANPSYNERLSGYLAAQFERQFAVSEPEAALADLIRTDIIQALRSDKDHRFFSAEFIATRLGMSRSTLYRKLQSHGTSFTEIIEKVRQQESVSLLKSSFIPLEEISEKLGYANLTAFNRAFRRWYQTSPAKFRNQS